MQFEWSWHKVLVGEPVGGLHFYLFLFIKMIVDVVTFFSFLSTNNFNLIYSLLNFYNLLLPVILINYLIFSTIINIFINNNSSSINVNVFSTTKLFFQPKLYYIKL